MTALAEKSVTVYTFVPPEKTDQFERVAATIYKEAVESNGRIPTLSCFHFFTEDIYGVSEALFEFIQDIHISFVDKSDIFTQPVDKWTSQDWEEVNDLLLAHLVSLQKHLLDDVCGYWNQQNFVYLDEHANVTEFAQLENGNIQEVW